MVPMESEKGNEGHSFVQCGYWSPRSPGDLMGSGNVPSWTSVLKVALTDTEGSWVQAAPSEAWQLEGGDPAQTKEGLGGLGCLFLCYRGSSYPGPGLGRL